MIEKNIDFYYTFIVYYLYNVSRNKYEKPVLSVHTLNRQRQKRKRKLTRGDDVEYTGIHLLSGGVARPAQHGPVVQLAGRLVGERALGVWR